MIDLRQGDCLEVMKTMPDDSKKLGRNFIGVELDEKYFQISAERIGKT